MPTQRWKVGAITITRVVELEVPSSARWLLPDASRENLLEIEWLRPHFCNADGRVIMSVHSFIVDTGGMRLLVDTCIGNDKRRGIPGWNMRQSPFVQQLAEVGHPVESIDRVVCTHLHVDHVGWNTRLVDGKWRPTFPNARYLFGREEYAHWRETRDDQAREVMQDSVQPVVDAGLVDLVESDHLIAEGIRLESTPGHTPGHVSVRIESQGEHAVITGDLLHHPAQCAHPEWRSSADDDPALAQRTRRSFLAGCADASPPTLVLGTHFATPTAGRIVRDGDAYRLVV
jgi:glyoxylase-like metal-dependent hydrolase (beta-lactamase superfamily II)